MKQTLEITYKYGDKEAKVFIPVQDALEIGQYRLIEDMIEEQSMWLFFKLFYE